MRRRNIAFTLLIIFVLLTSCEGFKVLTIINTSKSIAKITIRPKIEKSHLLTTDYSNNQTLDSLVLILQPDSSTKILSNFTSLLFDSKFKERDLPFFYLKIETDNDTIVKHSQKEIIDLIYSNKKEKNIKGVGRNLATIKIE